MTSTATKTVSGAKLAIATLAMLGAGSVALAMMPMASNNATYKWAGCTDPDSYVDEYAMPNSFVNQQLFSKSNTYYNTGAKSDYCYTFPTTGKTYLMEGICRNGSFSTWQKNCAELNYSKPGANFKCVEGACVDIPTMVTSTITTSTVANVTLSRTYDSGPKGTMTLTPTIGTPDNYIFEMKVSVQGEAVKLRSITVTASSTSPNKFIANDLINFRLFVEGNQNAIATLSEITCSANNVCKLTWTSTDNLLPNVINVNSSVNLFMKADINETGVARIGDNFSFNIINPVTDFVAVGASSGNFAIVSGNAPAHSITHIVPQTVTIEAVSPKVPQTVGLNAGATIGVFKVTNHGVGTVKLTRFDVTDNGYSADTMRYKLMFSSENENNTLGGTAATTQTKTTNFGDLTSANITISGGASRYLTVKTAATANNYDSFIISTHTPLDMVFFSIDETMLGYDGNVNGSLTDIITGLRPKEAKVGNEIVTARS